MGTLRRARASAGTGGTPYSAEVRAANGLATSAEARQADSDGQSSYQYAVNAQLNQEAVEGYNEVQRLNNPFYVGFKAGKGAYEFSGVKSGIEAIRSYNKGNYGEGSLYAAAIVLPILKFAKASSSTNTIYRVVTSGEAEDVLKYGFRQPPLSSKISSYEGKLFWNNLDDANWYKNWVGEGNEILKIKVDKRFIFENGTDVDRQFYFVSPERLPKFNSLIKSVKPIKK